MELIYLCH